MRKIKKGPIIISIVLILIIIFGITGYFLYKHFTSNEYKLGKIGYNENEVNEIIKLDNETITKILDMDYDKYIINLVNEKYFMWKNLDKYESYIEKSKIDNYGEIITKVNVGTYQDYYTDSKEVKVNENDYSVLVNKYHYLPENYSPSDIVKISNLYSYEGMSTREVVYEDFKKMWEDAKSQNLTLIVNSSYRNGKDQKEMYNFYKTNYGKEYADGLAARPLYSEHETGLALDIVTYNSTKDNFDKSDEFKFLSENSYKYGFILRYPKGKEDITGYSYESWHYRYLGIDLATKVYESGLTYDEYYAFYLEDK